MNAFSQMVSIISMNVNKSKLPATKGFAGYETWFTGATLIEIGVSKMLLVRASGFVALGHVILKFLRLNLFLWLYELVNSSHLFRFYIF